MHPEIKISFHIPEIRIILNKKSLHKEGLRGN
jgi:hypothetical protein